MSVPVVEKELAERHLTKLKQRCRVLLLLDAAEQIGITPLPSAQFHAFAYLADVLSPVWELVPFDGKIYKSDGGPHYPDLQEELDSLVVLGLVQVSDLHYEVVRDDGGARISGSYGLNFSSEHLETILAALGARSSEEAIDSDDCSVHAYLVELAGALATLAEDQIESATCVDITYRTNAELYNVVDFANWVDDAWVANPSWQAAERFQAFLPDESKLMPGEKLYLYAAYLGRAMHGN